MSTHIVPAEFKDRLLESLGTLNADILSARFTTRKADQVDTRIGHELRTDGPAADQKRAEGAR